MKPRYSVIIPVYNRSTLIGLAIESILAQTHADLEIIVVDDGSTDGTCNVVKQFRTSVQLISQSNMGPGAARNRGAREARGQYLTFLDSDDVWFPWTLQTLNAVIDQYAGPGFVAGKEVTFHQPSELQDIRPEDTRIVRYEDYYATSKQGLWIGTCGVAIRADVFHAAGGFGSEHVNGEDSDLWLRLGTVDQFIYIECPPLFGYRREGHSATADVRRTIAGIDVILKREERQEYPGGSERRRDRWEIITRHARPVSLACVTEGEYRRAIHVYWRTLAWHVSLGRIRYIAGFPLCLLGRLCGISVV
jgi:glycosyltransferase involved in cell wall biosynthesis